MTLASSRTIDRLVVTSVALLGMLIFADLIALYILTDFWNHPAVWRTKLGIAAQEILSVVFLSGLFFIPALILNKWGFRKSAVCIVGISLIASISLLVGGWSFYNFFGKFIGLYVLQMAMQDGRQILDFLHKMPSTRDNGVMAIVAVVIIFTFIIATVNAKAINFVRASIASITLIVVSLSVPASLLWNKPYKQTLLQNENFDRKVNRVQASEFEILSSKSGPFSAFNDNISSHLFRNNNFEDMDLPDGSLVERPIDQMIVADTTIPYTGRMPNIVLLLVESLRPDMLEAYGGDNTIMPVTNQLTKNGTVFTNMWAQASHSNYADISSLSGQYPLRSVNIHFYPKNPGYPKALPWDVLKQYGYHSGIFSSQNEDWGLMSNYLNSPNLDVYSHVGSEEKNQTKSLSKNNTGLKIRIKEKNYVSIDFGGFMYRSTGNNIERLDGITTKKATTWIDALPPSDPFFVYMNFQASHFPFNALPSDFERKFLIDDDQSAEDVRNGITLKRDLKHLKQGYQDSLLYVDQNISSLVESVKKRGDLDNTIFVIAADTSMNLNTKLLGNGGNLDAEVIKIPAIITGPGMTEKIFVDSLAGQIDLLPTVLTLAGAEPHPASQGVDILNNSDPERVIYSVAQTPAAHQYSAIWDNWQLIHDYDSGDNILIPLSDDGVSTDIKLSDGKKQWLAGKLQNWINTQLTYYSNSNLHENYFPPKYVRKTVKSDRIQTAGESKL